MSTASHHLARPIVQPYSLHLYLCACSPIFTHRNIHAEKTRLTKHTHDDTHSRQIHWMTYSFDGAKQRADLRGAAPRLHDGDGTPEPAFGIAAATAAPDTVGTGGATVAPGGPGATVSARAAGEEGGGTGGALPGLCANGPYARLHAARRLRLAPVLSVEEARQAKRDAAGRSAGKRGRIRRGMGKGAQGENGQRWQFARFYVW